MGFFDEIMEHVEEAWSFVEGVIEGFEDFVDYYHEEIEEFLQIAEEIFDELVGSDGEH